MKKHLLGIAAIVLAVGFSAFTVNHQSKPKKTFANYYGFEGTSNSQLNQTGKWVSLGVDPPSSCGGSNVVCIVTAPQTNLGDFQSAISSANPTSETELDNMSGVDIFSRQNP